MYFPWDLPGESGPDVTVCDYHIMVTYTWYSVDRFDQARFVAAEEVKHTMLPSRFSDMLGKRELGERAE